MEVNVESCDSLSGEEEPKLKYERLENDVTSIVAADAVSCVCVHEKLVVVGTVWGRVHVLDHEGHAVGSAGTAGVHAVAVNALSVDAAGEWVGSCADDGRVRVAPLAADDAPLALNLPRPVKAIALHPNYSSERCFLTGDERVSLHERRFLGGVRSTTICTVDGTVSALAWGGRFAAAAGGGGVRVIDTKHRVSLGLVQWEKALLEQSRCSLVWSEPDMLMIGWGDTVRICRVRSRLAVELLTRDATEYLVDPLYTFRTDYMICGLGPLDQQLVLLGVPREGEGEEGGNAPRPVLTVNDYTQCQFVEVSTDTLNIRSYEQLSPADYRLETLVGESRYLIVSPKDVVVASTCGPDDRVRWLVQRARWPRALQVLEENNGRTARHTLGEVGAQYADWLRERGEYTACAALVARVCANDTKLWEREVEEFAAVNQLRALSAHLPVSEEAALPARVYELVLRECVRWEPPALLALVREWPPRLYRPAHVVKDLLEHLLTTDANRSLYLEALALLYRHQRRYDKALNAYLKIQHGDVFALISEHRLQHAVHGHILELMQLDAERAVGVLLAGDVPVDVVVRQLEGHDQLLLRYLDAHSQAHPTAASAHHGRLVQLYARHSRHRLLPFLRASDCYPIQTALDVCQQEGLHAETVFLLARIGNTRDALHLIIHQLQDIPQAISFCQQHSDRELWTELVEYSVQRPECVTLLLRRVGGHLDPRQVVARVPAGASIPRLQGALARMMADHGLQLAAQAAARHVTLRDYFELHARAVATCRRGVRVGDDARCGACRQRLVARDPAAAGPLLVRACRHHYHARCLPYDQPCVLCAGATVTVT